MTAIGFDPLAIYYIVAIISVPVIGLLYTALTEHWYWKGFKDGKRLAQSNNAAGNLSRSR